MKYAVALLIIFLSLKPMMAQGSGTGKYAWPEGKTVAVCLTYDDGLDCHLDVAIPALDRHQLKGTFYCTGYSASLFERMEDWREAAGEGHELGNHTLFHPCHADRFDWVRPERPGPIHF